MRALVAEAGVELAPVPEFSAANTEAGTDAGPGHTDSADERVADGSWAGLDRDALAGSEHQLNGLVAPDAWAAQSAADSRTHSGVGEVALSSPAGTFARNVGEQSRMKRQGSRLTLTAPSAGRIAAGSCSLLGVTRFRTRLRGRCAPSCSTFGLKT